MVGVVMDSRSDHDDGRPDGICRTVKRLSYSKMPSFIRSFLEMIGRIINPVTEAKCVGALLSFIISLEDHLRYRRR